MGWALLLGTEARVTSNPLIPVGGWGEGNAKLTTEEHHQGLICSSITILRNYLAKAARYSIKSKWCCTAKCVDHP